MELVIGYLVSIIPAALMLLWLRKAVRNVEGYDRRCGKAFVRGMLSVLMVTLLGFILSVILGLTVDKKEQYTAYRSNQQAVVDALSSLRTDFDGHLWLEGFKVTEHMKSSRPEAVLHLIDCDMSDADWSFMNVADLHLTACTGIDWSSFGSADRIQALYIDIPFDMTVEKAKADGYYPEMISAFAENSSLKGIQFLVHLHEEEMPPQNIVQLPAEEGSIPEDLEYLLPYTKAEMKAFLNSDPQRKIIIVWAG